MYVVCTVQQEWKSPNRIMQCSVCTQLRYNIEDNAVQDRFPCIKTLQTAHVVLNKIAHVIVTFPYRKGYILDNKLEVSGIKLAKS